MFNALETATAGPGRKQGFELLNELLPPAITAENGKSLPAAGAGGAAFIPFGNLLEVSLAMRIKDGEQIETPPGQDISKEASSLAMMRAGRSSKPRIKKPGIPQEEVLYLQESMRNLSSQDADDSEPSAVAFGTGLPFVIIKPDILQGAESSVAPVEAGSSHPLKEDRQTGIIDLIKTVLREQRLSTEEAAVLLHDIRKDIIASEETSSAFLRNITLSGKVPEAPLQGNVEQAVEEAIYEKLADLSDGPKNDSGTWAETGKINLQEMQPVSEFMGIDGMAGNVPGLKESVLTLPQSSAIQNQPAEELPKSMTKVSGRITLTLPPENLGKLDMDVLVRDNRAPMDGLNFNPVLPNYSGQIVETDVTITPASPLRMEAGALPLLREDWQASIKDLIKTSIQEQHLSAGEAAGLLQAIKNDILSAEETSTVSTHDLLAVAAGKAAIDRDGVLRRREGTMPAAETRQSGEFFGDLTEGPAIGKHPPLPTDSSGPGKGLLLQDNAAHAREGAVFSVLDNGIKDNSGMSAEKGKVHYKEMQVAPGFMGVDGIAGNAAGLKETSASGTQGSAILDQVAEQVPQSMLKGSGRITLTLSPENLGKLDMDVLVRDNRVQVVFTAENRGVQQILQGHSEQLRELLQQQGLQVDGLNVMLRDQSQGQGDALGGGQAFWREGNQEATKDPERSFKPALAVLPVAIDKKQQEGTAGINIFV